MDVDKKIIKALASDTKVGILKKLIQRRKTPSELSKEIGLAPSTIIEHVKQLESLGLIKRIDTGHKWIYYELTEEGKSIIKPTFPMKITLILSAGFTMIALGFFGLLSQNFSNSNLIAAKEAIPTQATSENISNVAQVPDLLLLSIFLIGLLTIIVGVFLLRKR